MEKLEEYLKNITISKKFNHKENQSPYEYINLRNALFSFDSPEIQLFQKLCSCLSSEENSKISNNQSPKSSEEIVILGLFEKIKIIFGVENLCWFFSFYIHILIQKQTNENEIKNNILQVVRIFDRDGEKLISNLFFFIYIRLSWNPSSQQIQFEKSLINDQYLHHEYSQLKNFYFFEFFKENISQSVANLNLSFLPAHFVSQFNCLHDFIPYLLWNDFFQTRITHSENYKKDSKIIFNPLLGTVEISFDDCDLSINPLQSMILERFSEKKVCSFLYFRDHLFKQTRFRTIERLILFAHQFDKNSELSLLPKDLIFYILDFVKENEAESKIETTLQLCLIALLHTSVISPSKHGSFRTSSFQINEETLEKKFIDCNSINQELILIHLKQRLQNYNPQKDLKNLRDEKIKKIRNQTADNQSNKSNNNQSNKSNNNQINYLNHNQQNIQIYIQGKQREVVISSADHVWTDVQTGNSTYVHKSKEWIRIHSESATIVHSRNQGSHQGTVTLVNYYKPGNP